jgi:hypothetical protein
LNALNERRDESSKKEDGSSGIRTHAPEETGALNQRLRPLGHATEHLYDRCSRKAHFVLTRPFHAFHFNFSAFHNDGECETESDLNGKAMETLIKQQRRSIKVLGDKHLRKLIFLGVVKLVGGSLFRRSLSVKTSDERERKKKVVSPSLFNLI